MNGPDFWALWFESLGRRHDWLRKRIWPEPADVALYDRVEVYIDGVRMVEEPGLEAT